MSANVKYLKDAFTSELYKEVTLDELGALEDFVIQNSSNYNANEKQSFAILLNAKPVDQADWADVTISDGDQLIIVPVPQGTEFLYYAIFAVVVSVAATALIDIPEQPEAPPEASPTYSVNNQSNRQRLGAPTPNRYGRHSFYPDLASKAYREHFDNNEYWHQVFLVSEGTGELLGVKVGETPFANFEDAEYKLYAPGQVVDLFRPDVYTAPEISGQGRELFGINESDYTQNTWTTCNKAGTQIDKIVFDIAYPQGLVSFDKEGRMNTVSVTYAIEYQKIDDNGVNIGSSVITNYTNSLATNDPQRISIPISVAVGRYKARVYRTTTKDESSRVKNTLKWSGLRGYLITDRIFDQTVLAVKMRTTAQLSAQSERKINVVFQRHLPVYDGTNWLSARATRNPVWALHDMVTSSHAGDHPIGTIPLEKLKPAADWCDQNGFYFDGQFDVKITLWKAVKHICDSFRASPFPDGNKIDFVIDNGVAPTVGRHMFSSENIIGGSSPAITYKTPDSFQNDSIEVEFFDSATWKPDHIICAVPGRTATKPRKVKLFGITDRVQAQKQGYYILGKEEHRRRATSIKVELEGRSLKYLDPVLVQQEFMLWGHAGQVRAINADVLTLTRQARLLGANNKICLRDKDGIIRSELNISPVAGSPYKVKFTGTLPPWINVGFDFERTHYIISGESAQPLPMLVTNVRHDSKGSTVTLVEDNPLVYQYDAMITGGTITTPPPKAPQPAQNLSIQNLTYELGGTVEAPEIKISWLPVSGVKQYFIEYGLGGYTARVSATDPIVELKIPQGLVKIRVAAMGNEVGAWYAFTVDAGAEFNVPPTPTGLQLTGGTFTGDKLNIEWQDSVQASSYYIEFANASDSIVRLSESTENFNYSLDAETAVKNGLGRNIKVNLYGVNGNNVRSVTPATITAKNEQAAIPANIVTMMNVNSLFVRFDVPTETDFAGFHVFVERGENTVVVTESSPRYTESEKFKYHIEIPIPERATYQIRVAAFDAWGMFDELKLSTQTSDIAAGIRDSDLAQEVRDAIAAPTEDKRWKTVASNGTSAAYVALDATNGNPSLLILGADQVAIGNGTANSFPFIIDQNGTTYIRSAMIQDATITAAKIADAAITNAKIANLDVNKLIGNIGSFFWLHAVHIDANRISGDKGHFIEANMRHSSIGTAHIGHAQVDTLRIAGNAVTLPGSSYVDASVTLNQNWQRVSYSVHYGAGGRVFTNFSASIFYDGIDNSANSGKFYFRVLYNGGQVYVGSSRAGYDEHYISFSYSGNGVNAPFAIEIQIRLLDNLGFSIGSGVRVSRRSLYHIETKR